MRIKTKRTVICAALLLLFALATWLAYEPLKFRHAIWRIESARTVDEEREAMRFASRVGYVWEADRVERRYFEHLPARARQTTGDVVVVIEWLESSPWTGEPYRAYRSLLEPTNRELLFSDRHR